MPDCFRTYLVINNPQLTVKQGPRQGRIKSHCVPLLGETEKDDLDKIDDSDPFSGPFKGFLAVADIPCTGTKLTKIAKIKFISRLRPGAVNLRSLNLSVTTFKDDCKNRIIRFRHTLL